MSEIDWNVELRKIEREFTGLPPERTRTQLRLQKIQEITAKQRFRERLTLVGIWTRLVLVAALTLALFWWPYGRNCGVAVAWTVIALHTIPRLGYSPAGATSAGWSCTAAPRR